MRERYLLNKPGSTKETYHIVLDTSGMNIPFKVGDSIGIFPDNDEELVDQIIKALGCKPNVTVLDRAQNAFSLRDYLLKKANISKCTSVLLKNISATEKLLAPEGKAQLVEFLQTHQLVDILHAFPGSSISPQQLCSILLPMMPRFYSIASSDKMFKDEIHLTVASLTYETAGGPRRGVGSHFLGHSAIPLQTPIPFYVQPSNGFTLPDDPNAAIIMIGPGTGIAPFRAFLQERMALAHPGPNWLFFGERNRATDFYYADYFQSLEKEGRLRLDLAFSRDTAEKTYVQHLLWNNAQAIWDWMQKGAYLFVCGDAEKMAKDVELTLLRIAQQAGLSEEASREWLKALRKNRHYIQDVY
jgi:sulfite reductase (NADPH) flavoprotein alpha-component